MINARKKLLEVYLQHEGVTPGIILRAVKGTVRAFAHPVGVAVFDETALKEGFDLVVQGMMGHPIPKGRGGNQAAFGLVNVKTGVHPRLVGLRGKFMLQGQQVIFQMVFKRGNIGVAAFSFRGPPIGKD